MTPYQRQQQIVAENIKRSYEQTELIKALEPDLVKGKKANIGEIREWNGKKVQKTTQGWVEVNETGRKGGSGEEKEETLVKVGKPIYVNGRIGIITKTSNSGNGTVSFPDGSEQVINMDNASTKFKDQFFKSPSPSDIDSAISKVKEKLDEYRDRVDKDYDKTGGKNSQSLEGDVKHFERLLKKFESLK